MVKIVEKVCSAERCDRLQAEDAEPNEKVFGYRVSNHGGAVKMASSQEITLRGVYQVIED